ncbi:MAG: hypothetical protein DMF90_03285 [Acidobacteria bacterium]|nr:MAG: hypothetical protein DMF90_03285 [Acidobacteriota bacterium]
MGEGGGRNGVSATMVARIRTGGRMEVDGMLAMVRMEQTRPRVAAGATQTGRIEAEPQKVATDPHRTKPR